MMKFGGRLRKLTKQQISEIADEAAKIYFDYDVSIKESIRMARGMIINEKMDKVAETN